eukprot:10676662-Alexandrium_andersonii.AAC.1
MDTEDQKSKRQALQPRPKPRRSKGAAIKTGTAATKPPRGEKKPVNERCSDARREPRPHADQ